MPPPGQRHGSESFMSIIEIYLKLKKNPTIITCYGRQTSKWKQYRKNEGRLLRREKMNTDYKLLKTC